MPKKARRLTESRWAVIQSSATYQEGVSDPDVIISKIPATDSAAISFNSSAVRFWTGCGIQRIPGSNPRALD